jgi:hypothetical protein
VNVWEVESSLDIQENDPTSGGEVVKFVVFVLELVVNTGWLPGQLVDRLLPSPDYTVLGISGDLRESRGAVLLLEHLSPLAPGYEQLPEERAFFDSPSPHRRFPLGSC